MSHAGYITKILFDPPRRQLATVSNAAEVKIWDVVRGQEIWTFKDKLGLTSAGFSAIAFNPDGGKLAVAGDSGVVSLIDLRTGSSIEIKTQNPSISAIAFNDAGHRLVVGGFEGQVDIASLSGQSVVVRTVYEPPHKSSAEIAKALGASAINCCYAAGGSSFST